MDFFDTFTIRLSNKDSLWCAEFIDSQGNPLKDFPIFYSRYSLWAKAHALTWYADELYKIKKTTTSLN